MTTADIRETIELAKLHEQHHHYLYTIFEQQVVDNLHTAIRLPDDNPAQCLVDFIITYISHVPDFIDATRAITQAANIEEYADPVLQLAEDYFLKPPEIMNGHIGLEELMDEAYLAHRLMEEVNDRYMIQTSIPLIPMDMAMSNIIVHNLIGEPFANELDTAVHRTVERTIAREHVYDSPEFKTYISLHKNNHWEKEIENWACLTDQLAINLQLGSHDA